MAKYAVTVKEILAKTIIVEAQNYDEATNKICDAYYDGKIILDYRDFDGEACFDETALWGYGEIPEGDKNLKYFEHLDE